MATLTVASRANNSLTLPVILAVSFLSQIEATHQVTVLYEDCSSLGARDEYATYKITNGSTVVNVAIVEHVFDELSSRLAGDQRTVRRDPSLVLISSLINFCRSKSCFIEAQL